MSNLPPQCFSKVFRFPAFPLTLSFLLLAWIVIQNVAHSNPSYTLASLNAPKHSTFLSLISPTSCPPHNLHESLPAGLSSPYHELLHDIYTSIAFFILCFEELFYECFICNSVCLKAESINNILSPKVFLTVPSPELFHIVGTL